MKLNEQTSTTKSDCNFSQEKQQEEEHRSARISADDLQPVSDEERFACRQHLV